MWKLKISQNNSKWLNSGSKTYYFGIKELKKLLIIIASR